MKIKSARILGVVMALMLVASLIAAIPSTASAGTQSWSGVTMPSGSSTRLEIAGTDITSVDVASDGTIYAAAIREVTSGTWLAGDYRLLKSTNGGQTWGIAGGTTLALAAPAAIVSVVASKQTASRVYVAVSGGGVNQVRVSTNSGTSFALTYDIPATAGNIISMDVTFKTAHLIAVGTDIALAPDNIQILDESTAFPTWQANGDANITGTVNAVAFSPNFATDNVIFAIGDDGLGGNMLVDRRVGAGAWATIQTIVTGGPSAAVSPVPAAVIGFPSNFDFTTNNVTFVGLNQTPAGDDVYQIVAGAAAPIDLNANGSSVFGIASLVVSGPSDAASIFIGLDTTGAATVAAATAKVRKSTDSGTSWSAATKQPSGGDPLAAIDSLTFVALGATAGTIYAGTSGSALPGDLVADDQSAFSISTDSAASFNQRSLIDTDIASIDQLLPSAANLFVVSTSAAGVSSLWRTTATTAGADWWRILNAADPGAIALPAIVVGATPTFATDQTLWVAQSDTATATIVMRRTVTANGNATFTSALSPVTAASTGLATFLLGQATSVVVINPTTVLVGDVDGDVLKTTNNGVIWSGVNVVAAGVSSIALSGTTVLVGDNAGGAFVSTDTAATFRALGALALTAGNTFVGFDPGFATNGYAFAVSDADTDLVRVKIGTSAATDTVTTFAALLAGSGTGVAMFPGPTGLPATLYVSDSGVDAAPIRSINATNVAPAPAPAFEFLGAAATSLTGTTATLAGIKGLQSGSNTVWAIDTAVVAGVSPRILTYTDTLNVPAQAGTSVATGPTTASISWPAVANATAYAVTVTAPLGATAATIVLAAAGAPNAVVTTLTTGAAYTFTVNVAAPDTSYVSASAPMATQPGPGAWNPGVPAAGAAVSVVPAPGTANTSTTPTLGWNTALGATAFEVIVATAADTDANGKLNNGIVLDKSGANAVASTAMTVTPALLPARTYFWQVRASLGTSFSPWSGVFSFTTAAAPTTTPPPVTPTTTITTIVLPPPAPVTTTIITQAPPPPATTVTVNVPAPTTVTFTVPPPAAQPTPVWVWAIILIGGILLVVVIVLIARTRKV